MIGGKVIEVCDHPTDRNKIYVNVFERSPFGKMQECAVYILRTKYSEQIEIGDILWWQGNKAMWTPQENNLTEQEVGDKELKCGIDFDIQIPRIGFSGVPHPTRDIES